MNNINFDNPYLLLLGIPLFLIVILPFIFAIKKENINVHNITSFIFHLIIVILITLVFARMTLEIVITETNVYVVADASYSANENLDKIDNYIKDLGKNLPKNSKMGIVAFAKDQQVLTKPGEKIRSIKEATVDQSATDIASALEYTANLFRNDVIKRIVIISDGKETNKSNIVSIVESLSAENIYIDAIYIDDNLKQETKEVQITSIDYTPSTYLNKEETVKALVQSNFNTRVILRLYRNNETEPVQEQVFPVIEGLNVLDLKLDTSVAGSVDYKLTVSEPEDTSAFNNTILFTQSIAEKLKMLFISGFAQDKIVAERLYKDKAEIDYYINDNNVPYMIEDLCKYDEFVFSNLDIRELKNATQFIQNIDTLVAEFGKSLITLGNTYIQNKEDALLNGLSAMLPLKYGNEDMDQKLVVIVLDISRSMENLSHLIMAKRAACATIDLLKDDDMVAVIGFSGEIRIIQQPVAASNRDSIKDAINSLEATQGTYMGLALKQAYNMMVNLPYESKEVMLISDGKPYGNEENDARNVARQMARSNIAVSTLNTNCNVPEAISLMKDIAALTQGNYYYAQDEKDLENLILTDLADDITETEIKGGNYNLTIEKKNEKLVEGITELPVLNGFFYNKSKSSATTVITGRYYETRTKYHDVPVYAYWNYGNGKVSSFTSNISTFWTSKWGEGTTGEQVLKNILETNMPEQRMDTPFIFNVENYGSESHISVHAPSVNINSVLTLSLTSPDGKTLEKILVFDTENYIADFETSEIGKYTIELTYTLGNLSYSATSNFSISYSNEYDSFTHYEASNLYHMVSSNGQVSEDGKLKLENNNSFVQKYTYDFTVLFMVICVCLFVVDIMVRKLRLEDIKAFFRKKRTTNGR